MLKYFTIVCEFLFSLMSTFVMSTDVCTFVTNSDFTYGGSSVIAQYWVDVLVPWVNVVAHPGLNVIPDVTPSQCAGPGFWINWDKIPTANAVSGHDIITSHSTLPIASVYGILCMPISCVGIDGLLSLLNCAPNSIGVTTGSALVSRNWSTILSM